MNDEIESGSKHGREFNPNGSGQVFECIVDDAGPRMRVIIEGKRELVQRVLAIAGPEVQSIITEVGRAGRV